MDKVSKQNKQCIKTQICSLVANGMATLVQVDLLILEFALALESTPENQINKAKLLHEGGASGLTR